MPVHILDPQSAMPRPPVLMLMDGRGIRDALIAEAARLSLHGYHVMLPNLFYRGTGKIDDIAELSRMGELNQMLTPDAIQRDAEACIAWAGKQADVSVGHVGLFGYCIGARLAVVLSQRLGDRVAASVALHPGFMANRSPTSPHLSLDRIAAELYIAPAEHDPFLSTGQVKRLGEALKAAGVAHTLEILSGTHRGYGVPGNDEYAPEAAEHAWERALDLFGRKLA
jgi:carboxymethylenebutenolidase